MREIDSQTVLWSLIYWFLCLFLLCESASLSKEKSNCDPNVDIVFMLDGQSRVTSKQFHQQKVFIRDILERHESPAGAVQVGFVVCTNGNVTTSGLQSSIFDILENVRKLDKPLEGSATRRTDHCIQAINRVFSLGGRDGVKKIAVLLIGEDNSWNDKSTKAHVQEAKDNHVAILVITTDSKNFTRLHSLRNIASDDGKFFVLSSYDGLRPLSTDLSTGSCLPIALDLATKREGITSSPVTTPTHTTVSDSKCRSTGKSAFEKFIPFFGWIKLNCAETESVDLVKCECVLDQILTTKRVEITTPALNVITTKKVPSTSTAVKPRKMELPKLSTWKPKKSTKERSKSTTNSPHQTSTIRFKSTSVAPVDPSPNKMTSSYSQTLSTTTITTVSKIKSTLYPRNSVLNKPKVTPKIDLSLFLPPDERVNQTEASKADIQTLFNLLNMNNASTQASNFSDLNFNETSSSFNETFENNVLNSAIMSLLHKDMKETEKVFEDKLKLDTTKKTKKQSKISFMLPKLLHTSGKSVRNSSSAVPIALPSSLTIIDAAIKTLSNDSTLSIERENATNENKTKNNPLSSNMKLLSLLQAENSVQTNIISFLKNTTSTKSEILDNYTQTNSLPSKNVSDVENLPSESGALKNSSASSLLIKLLDIENTLQARLISMLNKENFLLGHTDYDYPDLPTLPPLLQDSTTSIIPIEAIMTTTPSTANTTAPTEVVELFKSDSELESAIAILMNEKSTKRVSPKAPQSRDKSNTLKETSDDKVFMYNTSSHSSEMEPLLNATETPPTKEVTTSSPFRITTVNIASSPASSPPNQIVGMKFPDHSPTKSSPVVTTTLQIVKRKVSKTVFHPQQRKRFPQRIRSSLPSDWSQNSRIPHSSKSSNMLSKRGKDTKTKLSSKSLIKDAPKVMKTNVTRPKTKSVNTSVGPGSSSKVTSSFVSSSSSPSSSISSSPDSRTAKPSPLTVVFRKIVKKDVELTVPKVPAKNKEKKKKDIQLWVPNNMKTKIKIF